MSLSDLTERTIRRCASIEAFERGEAYYHKGAVLSLVRRGDVIEATVQGSEAQLYRVRCAPGEDDAVTAMCTCPHSAGGWCKHVVAVCLCALHQPGLIEERATLDALLSKLDREQLQSLLLQLADHDPTVVEWIEEYIKPTTTLPGRTGAVRKAPSRRVSPGDAKVVRQRVSAILHSLDRMRGSEAYWQVGAVVDEVRDLLEEEVGRLVEGDQARDALPLLEAITQEYLANWEELDDSDGEASEFFRDLGMAWTEALLGTELSQKERQTWRRRLKRWQQEIDAYGIEDAFEAAREAAAQGWDYPALQRVLQGYITEQGAWEDDDRPYWADDLALARLHFLERRERWQEYLYLAEAEGLDEAYTTMLVRLQRVPEAVEYGLRHITQAPEVFSLAKALYEHGERDEGLQVAERGLTLQGSKLGLARWLRDEAAAMGDLPRAFAAAKVALREELSLSNYQRAQTLAGEQWPAVRDELLDVARHAIWSSAGQIDVLLYEGCIDDAIRAVDAGAYYTEIAKVVDAALMTHPAWAIQTSRKQAEEIMNKGQSQLYTAASRWLARARTAYLNVGQTEVWQSYLADLLTQHKRKYTLVPLLQALQ